MESRADDALARATRCLLVATGPGRPGRPPVAAPAATWWDGAGVWCTLPADGLEVAALRRDPRCVVVAPPPHEEGVGAVATATARLYSPRDPLRLALHAPPVLAALGALGAANVTRLAGAAAGAWRDPSRLLPEGRVTVRAVVETVTATRQLTPGPGIAPALPTVVPPEVRRLLAGRRRVVVAVADADGLRVLPAVWGAGFTLVGPAGIGLPDGTPATVVADGDDEAGLVLEGRVDAPAGASWARLVPSRALWWHDARRGAAELPAPVDLGGRAGRSGIVLPD